MQTVDSPRKEDFRTNSGSEFDAGENRSMQRPHRSENDRIVAGVCSGIAE